MDVIIEALSLRLKDVEDQALLADIAKTARNWSIRVAAVARVEDQALLSDIAKTDEDCDVRVAAVARVEDHGSFIAALRFLARK